MKKNFEIPSMEVGTFALENILTVSGTDTNVNIVKANLNESGVGENDVQTVAFDDLISMK